VGFASSNIVKEAVDEEGLLVNGMASFSSDKDCTIGDGLVMGPL
jgi:hypothetical protein